MFEPNWGWSLPAHLWLVSGWSAQCRDPYKASTCTTNLAARNGPSAPLRRYPQRPALRLDRPHVSPPQVPGHVGVVRRRKAPRPTASTGPIDCYTRLRGHGARRGCGIRSPTSPTSAQDHQSAPSPRSRSQRFFAAAADGNLPNVSWVTPDWADSDHPGAPIAEGQAWVTRLVNAVMKGPDWKSTAIFLAWDDWGGFYDHVKPPRRRRPAATGYACPRS